MNCRNFETLVIALARNQVLDATRREQGLAHQEICARCAKQLIEEQALLEGMRAVVADIRTKTAPAHLEAALLQAFREQQTAPASAAVLPFPASADRHAPRWKPLAIAAGILVIFSLMIFFWQQARALSRPHLEQAGTPAPNLAPESPPPAPPDSAEPSATTKQVAQQTPPKRLRRQNPASRKPEEVTEFFPLMEGEELEGLEAGQIVRVELPGSALLEVGVPIDLALASESVKADVVLGHDGLARAIRFVRE